MNTRSKSLENRFNNWQLKLKTRDEKILLHTAQLSVI